MGFFFAVEAEGGTTGASNVQGLSLQVHKALHSKLTVGCRAPLKHAIVLHKGSQPESRVPLLVVITSHLSNYGSRDLQCEWELLTDKAPDICCQACTSQRQTSVFHANNETATAIRQEKSFNDFRCRKGAHMDFAVRHRAAQFEGVWAITNCL